MDIEADIIKLERLRKIIGEKFFYPNCIIDLYDIINMIHLVPEINEFYMDFSVRSKEWHIGRVKYFVNNPEKIIPINIDDGCTGNMEDIIIDGCHRYLAQVYLGYESIQCYFSGLIDTLEKLKAEN